MWQENQESRMATSTQKGPTYQNYVIISIFDLNLDFLKVTSDSLPNFFKTCFICNTSHELETNIKAISHQNLGKYISTGKYCLFKGIGLLTYTCTLHESCEVAVHFAANIMKINDVIRMLYSFKHFGDLNPE